VGHVLIESHQAGHLVELTHRLPVHRRFPLQHVAIGRRHLLAPLTVPNRNQRSSPEPVCPTLPLGCVEVSARPHPYLTSPRVSVPADALVLSHPADWQEAVADVAGPQLILAGPGTGKTEFLARRVAHLLGSGVPATRLLVLTFSRRAAAELEARISAFLPRPVSGANASTFHSFAHRLVEAHHHRRGEPMPVLLTGPEQVRLAGRLLAAEDPADWPVTFRPLLSTPTLAEEVADFVMRCHERLLDSAALARLAAERSDWRALPSFLRRYRHRLREENKIDYGSLIADAVEILA